MSTERSVATRPVDNLGRVATDRKTFYRQVVAATGSEAAADALLVEFVNMGRKSSRLRSCTLESLAYGILRCASLRLNPAIPNEFWLIPRKGSAEPQFGYGGLRKLVMRSPEVIDCFSREVRENDTFTLAETIVGAPRHVITPFVPRGRVVGYYNAIAKANGHWLVLTMSVSEVEAHRDRYVPRDDDGQWPRSWSRGVVDREGLSSFDKMALKTVLVSNCSARDVSLTAEIAQAFASTVMLEPESPPIRLTPQRPALSASAQLDVLVGELGGERKAIDAAREALTHPRQAGDMLTLDLEPDNRSESVVVAVDASAVDDDEELPFHPYEGK